MKIRSYTHQPGGWRVEVEIPHAYTDGTSRVEVRFVPRDAIFTAAGALRPKAVRKAAIRALLAEKPFEDLIGEDLL